MEREIIIIYLINNIQITVYDAQYSNKYRISFI